MSLVLYSYRRCPYAIRARLALAYSGIQVELREVVLRDMPKEMLQLSPKATVPVLQLNGSECLDESIDIMHWALLDNDPDGWLDFEVDELDEMYALIHTNDFSFKQDLDKYKYWERHPALTQEFYRSECELFLQGLEERLAYTRFLFGDRVSLADFAIFPFVRQFSRVDLKWFGASPYQKLKNWLQYHEESKLLASVMGKHTAWEPGNEPVWLLPGES